MHHVQGNQNMIKGEFSSETIKAKKQWDENKTNKQTKNPVNQEFYIHQNFPSKKKGEIKAFQDMQRLRELVASRHAIKNSRESFRQKGNGTRWYSEFI